MHFVDITMFCTAEGGGVGTYLAAKSEWLARHTSIRHTIVGPGQYDGCGSSSFVGVPAVALPHGNGYRWPLSGRLAARALHRLQPDLIEVGDAYQFAWAALRVKRKDGVPVVAFYHSDLVRIAESRFGVFAGRVVARYAACLYRKFDLVLAPSQLMVKRLRDLGVEKVRQQPLGVDTEIFAPKRRDFAFRARLGLPENARLLVYAGRFSREKKLPLLLEAVQRLGDPYYLVMVGSGKLPVHSPRLIHLPFQHDPRILASVIASCDALVHPGDQETFGLVVLEAMACGIPVLGVAAGGVAELVSEDTGLLVPPGSAAALAQGLEQLYRSDMAQLGANGRQRALEKYDWNLIVPQLLAQYANLFAAQERAELEAGLSYAAK